MRGAVLTHTNNLPQTVDAMLEARLGALCVVTGWGLGRAWTDADIRQAARMPMLLVRTKTGDGVKLDPNQALAELQTFYAVRKDIIIRIGNEPNAPHHGIATDQQIWEYRYNVIETIKRLRAEMPYARIVSPSLATNNQFGRWLAIMGDVTALCDYVGMHAYEWHTFTPPGTAQLKTALDGAWQLGKTFGHKPVFFTEFGINDTKTPIVTRLKRCREAMQTLPGNVAGVTMFHICDNPIDQDQAAYAFNTAHLAYLR